MLQGLFVQAYTESWGSELNLEQMYSSDLLFWILNVLDMSKTGEINSNNHQIRNPNGKIDKTKLRDYSMRGGDTFARQEGIAPLRWYKVFSHIKEEEKKDDRFELMVSKLRGFRKE